VPSCCCGGGRHNTDYRFAPFTCPIVAAAAGGTTPITGQTSQRPGRKSAGVPRVKLFLYENHTSGRFGIL